MNVMIINLNSRQWSGGTEMADLVADLGLRNYSAIQSTVPLKKLSAIFSLL